MSKKNVTVKCINQEQNTMGHVGGISSKSIYYLIPPNLDQMFNSALINVFYFQTINELHNLHFFYQKFMHSHININNVDYNLQGNTM
jgi:hypothetical protein